ncbi:hypothetical protein BOX15_Mlig022884g1 [Macrostomum lignano]|uniref:Uncharacterized protein n=1 Tax=Macrostomum lignano TaxID=282301 RepID=A0A267DIK2_9PLAT|nr:hypothetical protein BOX15_Mlig022884g1 [Macrostomum lignano]
MITALLLFFAAHLHGCAAADGQIPDWHSNPQKVENSLIAIVVILVLAVAALAAIWCPLLIGCLRHRLVRCRCCSCLKQQQQQPQWQQERAASTLDIMGIARAAAKQPAEAELPPPRYSVCCMQQAPHQLANAEDSPPPDYSALVFNQLGQAAVGALP